MARTTFTGDFGKIAAWQKLLDGTPELLEIITDSGAEEILGLVKDGFRNETDPYGKRWKPKQVADGRKTLSGRTSRLKGGWHILRSGALNRTIAPSVPYATYHQTGTRYMPRRPMVPYRGLPRTWSKALKETAEEALSAHFTTGGSGGGFAPVKYKVIALKKSLGIKALIRRLANAAED